MRITTLTLETVTTSATGAVEFHFTPARPLRHRPGQAGLVRIPGAGAKPFTFSSAPDSGTVSIATTLASNSPFKQALHSLTPGSRVTCAGGFGTLPAGVNGPQVFVAQGIGITPFLSMTRTRGTIDATLLQVGAAHFFDDVAAAVTTAEHSAHREQLVAVVARTVTDRPDADWAISGRSDFVRTVGAQLRAAGVARRRIHTAAFFGMRAVTPAIASAAVAA